MQFADPDSARFALVGKLGGHFVPVIDRTILRQEVDGQKIYFAQETQVENAHWTKAGRKVVTACTPWSCSPARRASRASRRARTRQT